MYFIYFPDNKIGGEMGVVFFFLLKIPYLYMTCDNQLRASFLPS